MIKQLKKDSSEISRMAVVNSSIDTTASIENGVTGKALDINNAAPTNITNTNVKYEFINDETLKAYKDINKVVKVANLKFKVPDFLPEGYKLGGFHLLKLSDKDDGLKIYFNSPDLEDLEDSDDKEGNEFLFQVSEKDLIDVIKKFEDKNNERFQDAKIEIKEESMKLEGIDGLSVTITLTFPLRIMGNGVFLEGYIDTNKYFIWKNEGLWYSINYNSFYKKNSKIYKISSGSEKYKLLSTRARLFNRIWNNEYL
jgi:bla regulator protein BlaR1